jgi:hypothetical protein
VGARTNWPPWWEWELELTPHLLKRMVDRRFTEVDLRAMLEAAEGYRTDIVEGRFVIDTRHRRKRWQVIVEPDAVVRRLVVVTAYPVGR